MMMEEMITTICDTLDYNHFESTLSITTPLYGDQSTIGQLKSDLEVEKTNAGELKEQMVYLEAKQASLLRRNGDLESGFMTKENEYKRDIHTLRDDLVKGEETN